MSALGRWTSADTLVPEPGNPQSFNRYAYVLNRPLIQTDPSGHMPCGIACPGDWTNWEIGSGAAYRGRWDPARQAENRARAELVVAVGDVVLAVANEPYDWASTAARCSQGGCNLLDYAGFLPLVPGAVGRLDDLGAIGSGAIRVFRKLADGLDAILHDIRPFKDFAGPRAPSGWHAHHLVEKRFWRQLGFETFEEGRDSILSVMIPEDLHISEITGQLRRLIPNTGAATLQEIWDAHKQVYMQYEWGEDWLETIWDAYFKNKDVDL